MSERRDPSRTRESGQPKGTGSSAGDGSVSGIAGGRLMIICFIAKDVRNVRFSKQERRTGI
jgi:hypothetical protein